MTEVNHTLLGAARAWASLASRTEDEVERKLYERVSAKVFWQAVGADGAFVQNGSISPHAHGLGGGRRDPSA